MLVSSIIGNPVKFRNGPAAVIGDESCKTSLSGIKNEGKTQPLERSVSQKTCLIVKSLLSWTEGASGQIQEKKRDTLNRFVSVRGFLLVPDPFSILGRKV